MESLVVVLPLKRGTFRVVVVSEKLPNLEGAVRLSPARYDRWTVLWAEWWRVRGWRLALSRDMWRDKDRPQVRGVAGEE